MIHLLRPVSGSDKDAGLILSLTQMESGPAVRVPVELWENIFHMVLFDPLLFDHHSPIRWTFRPYYFHYRKIRRANLSQQRCNLMLVCTAWHNVAYVILRIYLQDTEGENGSLPPYPIHTIDRLYNSTKLNIEELVSPAFQSVQSLTSDVSTTDTVVPFLQALAQLPILRILRLTGQWTRESSPFRLSVIQRLFPRLVALSILFTGSLPLDDDTHRFRMDHLETFEYVVFPSTLPFHSKSKWVLPALRHFESCIRAHSQVRAVEAFLLVFGPQVETLGLHASSQAPARLPPSLWELTPNLRVAHLWGDVRLEPPPLSCPLDTIYCETRQLFRTFSGDNWSPVLRDRVTLHISTTFEYLMVIPEPFVTQEESHCLKIVTAQLRLVNRWVGMGKDILDVDGKSLKEALTSKEVHAYWTRCAPGSSTLLEHMLRIYGLIPYQG